MWPSTYFVATPKRMVNFFVQFLKFWYSFECIFAENDEFHKAENFYSLLQKTTSAAESRRCVYQQQLRRRRRDSEEEKEPAPQEKDFADADDIFDVDRAGGDEALKKGNFQSSDLLGTSYLEPYEMYKDLKKLLDKVVVGPKFENNHQPQTRLLGQNALARHKKVEGEKTKGSDWFNLPATELTEEHKRDLEYLQMRSTLDTLAHY
ncbi:unnamed protein product [Caenorhabditis nigoni]